MATSTRRTLTESERAERRQRDRAYAQQAVEQLRSSEGWRQWLRTRASFHSYSLGNQLLIAMQHPTAIRVAGFRKWLELGYCVRKGQKSIRIWAPCPPTRRQIEAWQTSGAKPQERPRTFFKLTAVFAQDQVQELPPPAVPAAIQCPIRELEGDEFALLLPRLIELATEVGSSVSFAAITGGARGFYEVGSKRIVIEEAMSANQQVATLCHELAHALVRAEHQDNDPTLGYAGEELIVESVAFTCIRSLGIDADSKSIPYLAAWAEQTDIKVIERSAELIDRLARRIETALHGDSTTITKDTEQDIDAAARVGVSG
jgi:antirestriction protein ArdC